MRSTLTDFMTARRKLRVMRLVLYLSTSLAWMPIAASGAGQGNSPDCTLRARAVLRVALVPGSPASLKPGAEIRGALSRPVYNANCQVLPEGTPVRAVVDHVEPRREKLWPFGWIKLAAGKR